MRSNNQNIRQIRQAIEAVSPIMQKAKRLLTLGLEGRQWLACALVCAMLLPVFSLPVSASVVFTARNDDAGKFEPVNEQLPLWEQARRSLNAKIEEWTTPYRAENVFYDENDDKKKRVERKGKKGVEKTGKNVEKKVIGESANISEKSPDEHAEDFPINEKLNIPAKNVKSIETQLRKNNVIQVGQLLTLSALPLDKKGNVVNGINTRWQSSDNEIIKIQDEQAFANKEGFAKLTVKCGNSSKTIGVTVIKNTQNSVSFLPSAAQTGRTEEEINSLFDPQNNLGSPTGQVEAQPDNEAVAMRRSREKPGSSNFSFEVPVAYLPGRGTDAGINLTYNSRVWNIHNFLGNKIYGYNTDQNWLSPGFNLSLGKIERLNYYNYMLTSSDGTRHQLAYVSGDNYARTYESTDGTFMRLDITSSNGTNTTSAVLKYADGTIVQFSELSIYKLYPFQITDRNGNIIQIAYKQNDTDGRIWYIKDTLNRYINFHYDAENKLVAVTVPGYNNSSERQTIRFYYETMNFPAADKFDSNYESMPTSVNVLKYVYFPGTNTGYKYDYSSAYGMIYKISDLRGMQVNSNSLTATGNVTSEGQVAASTTYNYPLTVTTPLSDVPQYTSRTDDWAGRTTPQAPVTSFNVEKDTINNLTKSKITSPDGTITETWAKIAPGQWDDGLVTETFVKTFVNPNYKIWSHTKLFWGEQTSASGRKNPRITKVELTNDTAQTKSTTFESDGYNNPTIVKRHDFAPPGQVGTEMERTEITYETNINWLNRRLVSLPIKVKKIVNNTTVSRTDFEYDNYGTNEVNMTPRGDLVMFDQTYNPSSTSYNPSIKYRGNVTKVTAFSDAALPSDPNASITTTKYDIAGNEVETVANCCVKFAWGYSKSTEYAYRMSEARGVNGEMTTSATYDYSTGLTKTMTDENSQITTYTYDQTNLRQTRIDNPDGGYSTFEYHDNLVNGPNSKKWSYVKSTIKVDATKEVSNWNYLDGRGAVVRSLAAQFNGEHQGVTDIEYDVMGRIVRASNPYTATSFSSPINPSNNWTVPTYDPLGRMMLVTLPDGNTTQIELNGTTATITDQAGQKRRQISDALGNVIRTDEPDANGNLGEVNSPLQPTYFEYDGNNNLTKITQTGSGITQERDFRYDSLSRLTHEKQVEALQTLNDNGVKILTAGQWTGVYKYNSSGLLIEGVNARGVKGSFTYDTLNRIKTVSFSDETGYQTPNITYTYDEERTGYFNKGQLTKIETAQVGTDTPATAQVFDYDLMGRTKKQTQTVGTNSYTLEYGYNLAGQMISEKYPSGRTVNFQVDTVGRLLTISDSQRTYASNFQYASHGALSSVALGNGTTQSFGYNQQRLQLTSQSLTKDTEVLQKYDYGYGKVDLATGNLDATKNNGQLARIDAYIGGTTSNPTKQWQQQFDYDSLGRLREVREHRGDTNALSYKYIFNFDRFGNLFRKQTSNPTTGQQTPLPYQWIEDGDIDKTNNHFSSATGTQYDEAGNVTRDTKFRSRDFKYDANGRMVWSKLANGTGLDATSIYDGFGQRVATKVDNIWRVIVYDIGGMVVAEYGGLTPTDEGSVKYILQDRQGSTRAILNQSGFVQSRFDYQAFGEEINSNVGMRTVAQGFGANQTLRNKYALTEKDEATGLDHAGWRKLENQAGRWTSPDPYKGSMSTLSPQSFNRYSYVNNDPINSVDPSGLDFCWGDILITSDVNPNLPGFEEWRCTSSRTGGAPGGGGRGGGGGGLSGGGQQGEQKKECPVKPLTPITDPEAQRFESQNGNEVNVFGSTVGTQIALRCIQDGIRSAGGSTPFLPNSAYRPQAYQDHFREVWDKAQLLRGNKQKECQQTKQQANAEVAKHSITEQPAKSSNHTRGTAFDISISGIRNSKINEIAEKCNLERGQGHGGGHHFNFVGEDPR